MSDTPENGGPTELSRRLWNEDFDAQHEARDPEQYQDLVFQQYRMYVEMTDRISSRRHSSNTYFLTLNTALASIMVAVSGDRLVEAPIWVLTGGLVLLLAQCATWLAIVHAYRQLNGARWAVIGAMEKRLPANAYSDAEWVALGEGKDWRKYLPLSHIEKLVPVIFAVAYVMGYIALAI
jgi:hypothetical protein